VTPSAALRTILAYAGDASRRSECEKAAVALSDREGIDVTYLGRSRLVRAKSVFPLHSVVWIPVIYALLSGVSLFLGLGIAILCVIFGGLVAFPHEHRIRESAWETRIHQEIGSSDTAVVIIGNDHLERLSNRLSQQDYRVKSDSLYEEGVGSAK